MAWNLQIPHISFPVLQIVIEFIHIISNGNKVLCQYYLGSNGQNMPVHLPIMM